MDRELFLDEVQSRLRRHFAASHDGYRMAPMDRHRLEGFMQAGVFLGLTNNAELSMLMEDVHKDVFGQSIEERKTETPLSWQYESTDYSRYEEPAYRRQRR